MSKRLALSAIALAAIAACSGGGDQSRTATPPAAGAPVAPAVTPTGHIITVELFSDDKGNYFKPSQIEAHRGDVVRFTLGAGVHNVHFLPDSNAGKEGLPPASELLQLPGQTYDLVVSFAPGTYYFQCDPHALLGMKGHLQVEP